MATGQQQIGLLSAVAIKLGWAHPPNWLLSTPLNTFLLMVIMIWIQTGFAMVVLAAALKGIPDEILEAARMDGAGGFKLFRTVQIPMIRGTLVVVITTIMIATLKVFDIVRTVTGGNFGTQVLSNKMYSETFVNFETGRGSALAVVLFLAVMPLVAYNVAADEKGEGHPMTTTTPPIVTTTVPLPGAERLSDVKKVRKAFSSPIASVLVVILTVLWTVPTFGLVRHVIPDQGATPTPTGGGPSCRIPT